MSQLEELIQRSRAPGKFVERKRFTLSKAKAIEKQREYALRHPTQYILELIQACVLSGATYIAIDISRETMLIAFIGGRPFQGNDLENIFDYLFADRADPAHRHLVQLAIGLNALLQRSPKAIRIESGDGKKAVRLEMDAKGKGQIGMPSDPVRGTYVMMEKAGSWFSRFQDVKLYPEQALVEERCVHCPVPIILNGTAPFGYTSKKEVRLFGEKQQKSFSLPNGRRGVVSVPKRPESGKGFKIVMGGVWVTTLQLPELGSVAMRTSSGRHADVELAGVICDDNLRKTADQSDIVQDARFTKMLAAVQPVASDLIEELTGERPSPPPLPHVEEDGPVVLPLPRRIPVIGPEVELTVDEVRVESETSPIFWLEPESRDALAPLCDPARFPFRVLVLQEGEARALLQEVPDVSLQRLGTAADVDFARRVLERNLRVREVTVDVERGRLTLRFHGQGPVPPWGDDGLVPALASQAGAAVWCGGLHVAVPHVSVAIELTEPAYDDLPHELAALAGQHAWRLLAQDVAGDPVRVRELGGTLLAAHARPQFAEVDGVSQLTVSLPPEWGDAAKVLRTLPLADGDQGPVTLDGLVALQGTDCVLTVSPAAFEVLSPLQELFGWGHLRFEGDSPLFAVGLVGERWVPLSGVVAKANPGAILWLSGHAGAQLQDARWIPVASPSPWVGAAVRPGWEDTDLRQGELLLAERLESLVATADWDAQCEGPIDRSRAVGTLAAWSLGRRLGRAPLPVSPSDGSALRSRTELWEGMRAAARGGVRVAERDTVLLSFDELRFLEADGPIGLRFDDDPSVWGSLVGGQDEDGWLIRHEVRLPGLHGWLGLRHPFDATTAILVRSASGTVLSVPEIDRRIPCHGLLWLERGRLTLSSAQAELLALEGLQLYQRLAEGLRASAFGSRRVTARGYGTLFAWLSWSGRAGRLGTVQELARLIPIEVDGEVWGTLEAWLRSPESGRPTLPISLPSTGSSPTTRRTALVVEGDLQKRVRALLKQLGRDVEVHLQATHERWGPPVRLDMRYSRYELLVLVLNHGHPAIVQAGTPGRVQELVLVEIARQIARWSSEVGEPLDLLAMQQVLVAQRLNLG
ncbi:MAG: hypothetical protein GY913_05280 [Proteobacteria bacterium]|nr:hypothetical protein [Pseudomonadota bacterium]MCP4916314.1 hypothetical protein [Pseudomonadota bacterium]